MTFLDFCEGSDAHQSLSSNYVSRPPDKLEKFSLWTQLSPEHIPGSDSCSQHELPREGLLSWGLPLEQSES